MTPESPTTSTRLSAGERRELVLDAALRAFAHGGYAGTSTDAVAKEAGVSQPYVVRIFGSKLDLFLEVYARATSRIGAAFTGVLEDGEFDPEREEDWDRLGIAYTELLADRSLLLVMMHGFSAGSIPQVAATCREGMATIFDILRGTGAPDEEIRDFIAQGMLMNVMLAMRAPEHVAEDPRLTPLVECAFGEALPLLTAETA